MLREFKKSTIEPVEITGDRYMVTIEGKIIDKVTNAVINSESTELVEIAAGGEIIKVRPEIVIAMGFKPLYNSETFWFNWSILFADGNEKNLHPGNLIWKPPTGGQECPNKKGFYVVPGSSQFAVNMDGTEIFSRRLKRNVKQRANVKKRNQTGFYLVYNGYSDTGKMTTSSVHRAVALALLDYDETVDEITVNHKNGIKNNNWKDNLEWATYSENNNHARDTGLCNTRIPVYIKDYKTGIVTRYKSMVDAGIVVGYDAARMVDRLRYRPNKWINFRYYPSFTDLGNDWPSVSWSALEKERTSNENRKEKHACAALDIFSGITYLANSRAQLSEHLPLSREQVRTGLKSKHIWPSYNFVFWYLHAPKSLRSFEKDELEAFRDRGGIKKPLRVTYSEGDTRVFITLTECAESLEINRDTLWFLLADKGGKAKINDVTIEYLKQ